VNGLKSVWREFVGLFVDDGSLALSILVWLAVCGLALPRLGLPSILPPLILFAGLVVVLARSALARAAKRI